MICYHFPPLGGIGSLRARNFALELPRFGWEVEVLAPSGGSYYRDPTLAFPEQQVTRSFSLELSRLGKRVVNPRLSDTEPASPRGLVAVLQGLARRYLYEPDSSVGWLPFAARAGRRLLRSRRFDALFSSALPMTAHLVAERLHRQFRIPWIAEFRDPWAEAIPSSDPRRPRFDLIEARILRAADTVVATSPSWAERFGQRGARRTAVITNGVRVAELPPARVPDPRVLAHLGTSYPDRQDFGTVLRAIATLRTEGRLPDGFRLRFIGRMPGEVAVAAGGLGIGDVLEATGFVSHEEALQGLTSSGALLLGGPARDGVLRGWIPAKVFEYLATDRPILYVGDPEADVTGILRAQPGCHLVTVGDVAAMREAIVAGMSDPCSHSRDLGPFSSESLAEALRVQLDALVER